MTSVVPLPSLPAFQLLGQPVELPHIERELQTLFLDDRAGADASHAGGIARASLINLALYNENQEELERDASVLAELTSVAACRSLLICADPRHPVVGARAWIQAHCQINRKGEKSVCSEQISFFLTGHSPGLLRNVVFAHLDSDLPLAFWWRGEFSDAFEERLYSRIDRLLFDSETWASPRNQFIRLLDSQAGGSSSFAMHDLAFTRLNSIRHAIANAFDRPAVVGDLASLSEVRIRYAKGYRMSSLYLAAWITSKLEARFDPGASSPGRIVARAGRKGFPSGFVIHIEELDPDRKGTLEVDFHLGDTRVEISRCQTRDFFRSLIHRDVATEEDWLPARRMTDAALVTDILNRAGRNRVYASVLPGVREFLTL